MVIGKDMGGTSMKWGGPTHWSVILQYMILMGLGFAVPLVLYCNLLIYFDDVLDGT